MTLLPIAPIVLLPFIAIFFIVVFPFWLVALAVLGLLMLIIRGLDWLVRKAGSPALAPIERGISKAFHWTLSWGGIANRRDKSQPKNKAS